MTEKMGKRGFSVKHQFSKVLMLAGALLASNGSHAQAIADTIYSGGPILTINDRQPVAEAVAVAGYSPQGLDVYHEKTSPTTNIQLDSAVKSRKKCRQGC